MQRSAVSNCPICEFTLAKHDNHNGIHIVVPVDRMAVRPEVIVSTASEALPVRADKKPRVVKPIISRNSSASELFSRSVRRVIISSVIAGSSVRLLVGPTKTFTGDSR
jgi:hypothetical protein